MATELSLGDAVRQFALRMKENKMAMPYKNEAPWHFFFYRLKKEMTGKERPAFLDNLRFDADGHYPRSRELSEFLHALHTTCAVRIANPSYDEITLQPQVTAGWERARKSLDCESMRFLDRGFSIAKEEFPQKQN